MFGGVASKFQWFLRLGKQKAWNDQTNSNTIPKNTRCIFRFSQDQLTQNDFFFQNMDHFDLMGKEWISGEVQ